MSPGGWPICRLACSLCWRACSPARPRSAVSDRRSNSLETRPGGSWVLAATACGLMAFGAFAFVEARFRRIRPPRDLDA
ncbi:DUF1206 domain-containing protein [Brevundimonas sp. R86498]|uniref:DUF1206 domain-containing protein n=1 Tax=Brevundimonas sp. R86498 TaxID=3093845 RepID=UPI0037C8F897